MARLIAPTLILMAALVSVVSSCCGGCQPGWTRFRCGCYRFFNNPRLNWVNAEARCRSEGGAHAHLASIETAELSHFLVEYWKSLLAPSAWNDVWIGNNDRSSEGTWVWVDGSPTYFTQWSPGRPNQAGDEDCGEIWNAQPGQGNWNDDSCSKTQAFVCEYPLYD